MNVLRVALDVPVAKLFEYLIDDAVTAVVGDRVVVPFGARQRVGVVVEIAEASTVAVTRLKPIDRVLGDAPRLTAGWLEQSLVPYAMFLQTVPVVAVAPLFVLWFGIGFGSVAASSFIVAVFPVINAAAAGLRAVEPDHRALFVLYKASRWQTFWRLEVPSAAPFLAAGLRSASGLAVIGAVVGEFVSGHAEGNAGLGTIVLAANRQMQTSLMFAAVLCCSVTGLAMFGAVSLGARAYLGRWHASGR